MPRSRKAATKIMNQAATRLANCKSIEPDLDLGNGLKNSNFETTIVATNAALDAYNMSLAQSDALLNAFNAQEKLLKDVNERMLIGVGAKYGKDSTEYEKAGGVRKSERKKPTKKIKP